MLVIQGWNVFMTSCWPQVCIEHYLNIEQCGWGVPDRNDWFEAVFSDTFKWIFRITRNSKLNLHELLARAVVHLGEWYPYLVHVASTMCNPQRKKDFFMIDYVLFALYKILFVLPKKKKPSAGSHFSHLQNFLNYYQTSKMLSRIFGSLQFFVRCQNPLFLDSYPLLGHLILRT